MPTTDETCDDSLREPVAASRPEPGVVAVLAAGSAVTVSVPVEGEPLEVGRASPPGLLRDDDRVSRRHVRIARERGGWRIEDLGSRNGTVVDGRALPPGAPGTAFPSPCLVRVGRSLLWCVDDVLPFAEPPTVRSGGAVTGGALRRAYGDIALAARAGDTLCVRGESGAGKELAARAFHDARHPGEAPFVGVNCAAIPEGLAERLLFGARKGSYSGATADAEGYVQSAHGGTLFLDEIAELDPLVQAKLLRVLETREVLPLGASRPTKVSIAVCAASHKPLRSEVTAGRFREDLYFRVARPEVALPPLRERVDEIPMFVERALRDVDPGLTAAVTLVEACCLRPWPGNVRELLRELRRAAHAALHAGARAVDEAHLAAEAGFPLGGETVQEAVDRRSTTSATEGDRRTAASWSDDDIRRALGENAGNVRGTARALGMHRNQLRRWLAKHPETPSEPDTD